MTRVIHKIDISGSSGDPENKKIHVTFIFENYPSETFKVDASIWLKILADGKERIKVVSWNEVRNEIYYSVVMEKHELISIDA